MNSRILKVGLVQQSVSGSREQNLENSAAGVREAVRRGAQLVLLQELHCGPYFCQHESTELFGLAEPIPGPG
ncbi:MAG: acyltransferase, partial [Hydrocarboniphaga effusa]|nr:acyltransferase [Hydrocarboniphaga effusa]